MKDTAGDKEGLDRLIIQCEDERRGEMKEIFQDKGCCGEITSAKVRLRM